MRFLLVVCVIFLLLNCEDKQTSKQTNITVVKDSVATKNTSPKKESNSEFLKLTDNNAMDFFLEYEKEHKEDKVRITTDFGTIDIQLYNKTKFHRANFIYLTKRKYFDGTQFYRVVKDFVIQGGSSDDYNIAKRRRKIGKYLLPPDTKRGYTHKRGAADYLDKDYTVFGEVINGLDVVDKIAKVETDQGDWPLQNVYIKKVEIIK